MGDESLSGVKSPGEQFPESRLRDPGTAMCVCVLLSIYVYNMTVCRSNFMC